MRYFVIKPSKLTLREAFGLGGVGSVLGLLVLKAFPSMAADVICRLPNSMTISEEEAPADLMEATRADSERLVELGFSAVVLEASSWDPKRAGLIRIFSSGDGSSVGAVIAVRSNGALVVSAGFTSHTSAGEVIATSNASTGVPPPPHTLSERLPSLRLGEIWSRHRQRIAGRQDIRVMRGAEVREFLDANEERLVEYQLSRGLLVEIGEEAAREKLSAV